MYAGTRHFTRAYIFDKTDQSGRQKVLECIAKVGLCQGPLALTVSRQHVGRTLPTDYPLRCILPQAVAC